MAGIYCGDPSEPVISLQEGELRVAVFGGGCAMSDVTRQMSRWTA